MKKPLPLSSEQESWLEQFKVPAVLNPCIRAFGKGPEGVTCKTCDHLFRKRYSRVYIKCDLRPNTNGQATDHRANWPACAKYTLSKLYDKPTP